MGWDRQKELRRQGIGTWERETGLDGMARAGMERISLVEPRMDARASGAGEPAAVMVDDGSGHVVPAAHQISY